MRFHADPLLDEIRQLREQLDAAFLRNGELAGENAVLRDRIEVAGKASEFLADEARANLRRASEAEMRVAVLQSELRDYEQSMARANLEILRLRGEAADLQRQVDEDEEQISYLEDLRR